MMGMMGGAGGAGGAPANSNNQPDEERFKDQIQQCKDMGFDDQVKVISALKACNGNVDLAVERLLNDA